MGELRAGFWTEEHEHIEFRYMCGEVEHSGALEEAGVPEADAIIIGPAENLPDGVVSVPHMCISIWQCFGRMLHRASESCLTGCEDSELLRSCPTA